MTLSFCHTTEETSAIFQNLFPPTSATPTKLNIALLHKIVYISAGI